MIGAQNAGEKPMGLVWRAHHSAQFAAKGLPVQRHRLGAQGFGQAALIGDFHASAARRAGVWPAPRIQPSSGQAGVEASAVRRFCWAMVNRAWASRRT